MDVVRVGLGAEHSCAIRADGELLCWGRDDRGQLGQTGADRSTPGAVTLDGPARDVSGGNKHTCIALRDGRVFCTGENGSGQLADGTMTDRAVPVQAAGLDTVVEVALGGDFSCARAISAPARVACWGDNAGGQLADGTTTDREVVLDVPGLTDALQITAGELHACAVRLRGSVDCWGSNGAGRLGDSTTTDRRMPVSVALLGRVLDVSAGDAHTCAARADGAAVCWGTGADGRLGNGGTVDAVAPVRVMGLP
jgi:alpha-tubulin suppressor-like RCC1 family protein